MTILVAAPYFAVACGSNSGDSTGTNTQPTNNTATLSGTVTDVKTGGAIAAATVSAQGKSAVSASNGTYTIAGLSAGSVTVTVQHQGHDSASTNVTLTGGGTATSNFALTPAFAAALAGNWAGSWKNTTFTTTGAASMTGTADTVAQTFTTSLSLGGMVFGVGNAPALAFNGAYTVTAGAANVSATSLFFGTMTVTITPTGQITGSLVGPMGGILRVDFTGTATAATIAINYTVTIAGGGSATGTLTLTKSA